MILDESLFEAVQTGDIRGSYKKKELSDEQLFDKVFEKLQSKLIAKHYKVGTDGDNLYINARVLNKKLPNGRVVIKREFLTDKKDYEDIIKYLDEVNVKHEFKDGVQGLRLSILLDKDNAKDVNMDALNKNVRVKNEDLPANQFKLKKYNDNSAVIGRSAEDLKELKQYYLSQVKKYNDMKAYDEAKWYQKQADWCDRELAEKENISEDLQYLSKDEIDDSKRRWVKTEEDEKVWDSLSDEDKEFLTLCVDMGFWFDEVQGNEELEDRYEELRSKFSLSLKESLFTVELYKNPPQDPEERIRFDSYKKAMDFANTKTNGDVKEIYITKPTVNGPSIVNSWNGKWYYESLRRNQVSKSEYEKIKSEASKKLDQINSIKDLRKLIPGSYILSNQQLAYMLKELGCDKELPDVYSIVVSNSEIDLSKVEAVNKAEKNKLSTYLFAADKNALKEILKKATPNQDTLQLYLDMVDELPEINSVESLNEGFAIIRTIEDAQREVDEQIEKFGRIGGGLYDDLDDAGFYVDNDNKVQYKVKPIEEDLNTFDYDKLQKELEAIPNVTKVDFDKDLIYDTKELVVLVNWHSDSDTAQWFRDKVAVKTKALEVFKNNGLKLSDPIEDNGDYYYYFVLREITPKAELNETKHQLQPQKGKLVKKDMRFLKSDTGAVEYIITNTLEDETDRPDREFEYCELKSDGDYGEPEYMKYADFINKLKSNKIEIIGESLKEDLSKRIVIKPFSGLNADGFKVITYEDNKLVNETDYRYGYNASYSREDAEYAHQNVLNKEKYGWKDSSYYQEKPYIVDILKKVAEENNLSVNDLEFIDGEYLFNGKVYSADKFKQELLNKSLKEELSPEKEKEYGLTTMINSLIKDEIEAIDGYNSAIVTLEAENKGEFTDVIRDIISEENKHIGQLQAILKELNPSTTANIDEGQKEGQEQIDQAVGVTEGDTEETTTTIDTEEGVIKTYKLDKVEDMKESLNEDLKEYDPEEGWTEEDIELHKSIDWKARNYEDYEVAEDSFKGKIHCVGANEDDENEYTFHKFIRPNALFAPYYKAVDFDNGSKGLLSPMYDGRKHNGYLVMDRYETQEVYDMLSEELSGKKLTKEEIKQLALDNFENGGDVVYSAWDDSDIEEFIQEDGTKKGLLDMFKKYHSIYLDGKAAAYDANHLKPAHSEDEEDDPDNYPNDFRPDDNYDRDYGPNNPWDAPGMRVSDFIKGVK